MTGKHRVTVECNARNDEGFTSKQHVIKILGGLTCPRFCDFLTFLCGEVTLHSLVVHHTDIASCYFTSGVFNTSDALLQLLLCLHGSVASRKAYTSKDMCSMCRVKPMEGIRWLISRGTEDTRRYSKTPLCSVFHLHCLSTTRPKITVFERVLKGKRKPRWSKVRHIASFSFVA